MVDGDGLLRPASPRAPLLRLATWNVNSIRIRLDRVLDWMRRADIDILAMQETKCADDQFPALPFFELGYEVAHCGFNQWNGVAIASRVASTTSKSAFPAANVEQRPARR
ncbi:endonuclease/Exonuclease/phosphatase family protein [Mycobacterium xenopi 4042]|uniref:Endonuclease/Exonuclease/phosphatase family protein n=1 Tax=Mycobacterium xenopi 4042 TaxID=1299334 RepID=X8DMQ3_MYCXE|nr:endonuclease/Exonuclease/phosphatase family protein [Mycobacterium xenopi 4042]